MNLNRFEVVGVNVGKLSFWLSLAALTLAALNLVVRLIFRIPTGWSVTLLIVTALIFCGCLVWREKNGRET